MATVGNHFNENKKLHKILKLPSRQGYVQRQLDSSMLDLVPLSRSFVFVHLYGEFALNVLVVKTIQTGKSTHCK